MEDLTLPLATMRSMMRGFRRFDQRGVLEPYASRYFQALANVWKERDIEIGLAFARMMYPSVVVDDHTIKGTDQYLARENVPARRRAGAPEGRATADGRARSRRRRIGRRARAIPRSGGRSPRLPAPRHAGWLPSCRVG